MPRAFAMTALSAALVSLVILQHPCPSRYIRPVFKHQFHTWRAMPFVLWQSFTQWRRLGEQLCWGVERESATGPDAPILSACMELCSVTTSSPESFTWEIAKKRNDSRNFITLELQKKMFSLGSNANRIWHDCFYSIELGLCPIALMQNIETKHTHFQ